MWGDKLQLYSNKEKTIGLFFATPDVGVYEDIKMQLEAQIPQGLKEKVDRELQPDERILWMDIPIPTFFTPESTKIFIFGIFFTSFAVFWTFGAAGFAIPNLEEVSNPFQFISILFPLFGLPFILIGLFLLLNPLFAYAKALKTVYLITDRRAMTFETGWSKTVRSYPPSKLLDVYRKERGDGTGDVIISSENWTDSDDVKRSRDLGFFRIRAPRTVEMMLRDLAKQAGIDVSIKPPSESMMPATEPYYASLEATLNEGNLTQPRASTRIGKLIVVLIFTLLIGYNFNSSSLQDYKKGQSLTLNEYVKGFEDYKAGLLHYDPLWLDVFAAFLIVGLFFGSYELSGKGLGWILWRITQARRRRTSQWRREN